MHPSALLFNGHTGYISRCKAFESNSHHSLPTSKEVHTVRLLNTHIENSKILGKPSFSQHYRLAALCASLRQLLFYNTHCLCFTVTVNNPLYTLYVLHCDSCCSTLNNLYASLRCLFFHSTHCVLHCDSYFSTLHTVCASLRQLLFHSTHCVCCTITLLVQSRD